jgi:protein phosphatase
MKKSLKKNKKNKTELNVSDIRKRPGQLKSVSCQSVGKERSHNEDAILSLLMQIKNGDRSTDIGIFMIADGMGGHVNGEKASQLAINATYDYLLGKFLDPVRRLEYSPSTDELEKIIEEAIFKAQERILQEIPGGGTTLTAAIIYEGKLTYGHVGDSRLYVISPDGSTKLITKDHSLVKRLIDLGQISPAEAINHPQRNVLFRALGQSEAFKVDVGTFELENSITGILCSDGLWGQVADEKIFSIISQNPDIYLASEILVNEANLAGGIDNISVILFTYS